MHRVLFILGTRPEVIKLAPLIKKFNYEWDVKICLTGQHREMLRKTLNFFDIVPDYNLNVMKTNQSLFDTTAEILKNLEKVLEDVKPELIFVQGDTTTAFVGALSGFYKKISVAHVEAGLRSKKKYSPFPEEINRVLISKLSDYHFVPTEFAKRNLSEEGITKNVYIVGNTVIDALLLSLRKIKEQYENDYYGYFNFIDFSKRIILVTGHRRESFGKPFENICLALKDLSENFDDIEIVYPVHMNPNVRKTVYSVLENCRRVHLIEPLDYPSFIWLMDKSYFVLTDSGGIQEEAPSLGKPVLVMRNVTERVEGIVAGTAKLVGTTREKIFKETANLLSNKEEYERMKKRENPYGDGKASDRIYKIMCSKYNVEMTTAVGL